VNKGRSIARYLSKGANFPTPHLFGDPVGSDPVEFLSRSLVPDNQSASAIVRRVFARWYFQSCNWFINNQRYTIASRGKKEMTLTTAFWDKFWHCRLLGPMR